MAPARARAWTITRTPPGEAPPPLGQHIPAGAPVTAIDSDSTYSVAYYTPHVDFAKWSIVKLPGLPSMCLSNFWRTLALQIQVYALLDPTKAHSEDNKAHVMRLTIAPGRTTAAATADATAGAATAAVPPPPPPPPSSASGSDDETAPAAAVQRKSWAYRRLKVAIRAIRGIRRPKRASSTRPSTPRSSRTKPRRRSKCFL
jgi:hypothetical protein